MNAVNTVAAVKDAAPSGAASKYIAGLDGVVAARTRLSHPDGEAGELVIAGFRVDDLAPSATFEELAYLLWNGALPNAAQLKAFAGTLAAKRSLHPAVLAVLRAAAADRVPPMDALRMGAGALGPKDADREGLFARLPVIAVAYWNILHGREPVAPRADLGHSANYLWMLTGELPRPEAVRGMDTYLNTVSDHGLNASTFAARVIISTRSDLASAVVGAIGALKGPLHGGAPGPALDMVFEIGTIDRADAILADKVAKGERFMGFGHRIYRTRDPRADVLGAAAERMLAVNGDEKGRALHALARGVEKKILALLAARYPDRRLDTNVEFYTALLLHGLGLHVDMFSPTFAVGRAAGWIAHCAEQLAEGKLLRPQSEFIGDTHRKWVGVDQRG